MSDAGIIGIGFIHVPCACKLLFYVIGSKVVGVY